MTGCRCRGSANTNGTAAISARSIFYCRLLNGLERISTTMPWIFLILNWREHLLPWKVDISMCTAVGFLELMTMDLHG